MKKSGNYEKKKEKVTNWPVKKVTEKKIFTAALVYWRKTVNINVKHNTTKIHADKHYEFRNTNQIRITGKAQQLYKTEALGANGCFKTSSTLRPQDGPSLYISLLKDMQQPSLPLRIPFDDIILGCITSQVLPHDGVCYHLVL